jgi:hypothetical protein
VLAPADGRGGQAGQHDDQEDQDDDDGYEARVAIADDSGSVLGYACFGKTHII